MKAQEAPPIKQQLIKLVESGKLEQARDICLRLCSRKKNDIEARMLLAAIYGRMGNYGEMASHSRKVIKLQPGVVSAHHNLGIALASQGLFAEAAAAFKKALAIKPDYTESRISLADVLAELSEFDAALTHLNRVIREAPGRADLYYKSGMLNHKAGNTDEAVATLEKAIALKDDFVDAYKLLHYIYYEDGEYGKARACCAGILKTTDDDGTLIREAVMVPVMMDSIEQTRQFRAALAQRIDALLQRKLSVTDPLREIGYTSFQLAYHGLDDRPLQESLARLYSHACPALAHEPENRSHTVPSASGERIKIGFISAHLKNHSIGKALKGLLTHLPRDTFNTTLFFVGPPADDTAEYLKSQADSSFTLTHDLASARSIIENEHLDILFYQDIGMEPFTYFLAFSRLAPVQCTYFGHPVTTGIPNMDYFISTNYHEPDNSSGHYSERLILLNDVAAPSYCIKPEVPDKLKTRDHFGFSSKENIYFCPQTLFKFHPDLDLIFANILRSDDAGRIILKVGNRPNLARLLTERYNRSIPDVVSRITFLPQQSLEDYFSLIATADAVLDTVHFGGFTTTIDAMAVDTPVVTWPTQFMRGRHTAGFYRKMGIDECTAGSAGDYATKAVRLARDKDFRNTVREQIRASSELVWEEKRVIREYGRIFSEMVNARIAP